MVNKFELSHDAMEATTNICSEKGKGTVDQSIVTRWFKKLCSGYKNLNNQARSIMLKIMDSVVIFPIHTGKFGE